MKSRRWLLAVVAALAVLFVGGWRTQRPLARIALPNGGELVLVEMRYGPTVRVEEPIDLLERLRHYFSSQRHAPLRRSVLQAGYPDSPPLLWLIFEQRGGRLRRDNITTIHTLDPASPEIEVQEDTMVLIDDHATRNHYLVAGLNNYPRRSPQVHVIMNLRSSRPSGHDLDFTVRNPFQVTDAPQWTPEPIPQVRKFKYGELALRNLPRKGHRFEPDIELLHATAPLDAYDIDHRFRDATGNLSQYLPPPSEPALNLHYTIAPNSKYPFSEKEFVPLARTTMPRAGEYRLLPLPLGLASEPYRDAVLFGPGTYQVDFKDGLAIQTKSPRASGTAHYYGGPGNELECYGLEFVIIRPKTAELDRDRPVKSPWILRGIYDGKTIPAEQRAYQEGRDADVVAIFWEFRLPDLPDPTLAVGKALQIQFVPVIEEGVDFFVKPEQ